MTAETRIEYADVFSIPPSARTWCGRFRCCRERNHVGACEEDVTMLDQPELDAIVASRWAS